MTASEAQVWVGIVGSLITVIVSVLGVLGFQRRRDRSAAVGTEFRTVVDALASGNATKRMAAAIMLRRFFSARSEQGAAHLSYAGEAVAVIAGLLRDTKPGQFQKLLADGLRYAPSLRGADLQGCDLSNAYLGQWDRDELTRSWWRPAGRKPVDLSGADLFTANLTRASLKGVAAAGATFLEANLEQTVFSHATLTGADFRRARLSGAKFDGADLTGARFDEADLAGAQFSGATGLPAELASRPDTATAAVATPVPELP
jgi:uncharacterized protein YjbI with pentapeptide repeats